MRQAWAAAWGLGRLARCSAHSQVAHTAAAAELPPRAAVTRSARPARRLLQEHKRLKDEVQVVCKLAEENSHMVRAGCP